MTLVNLLLVFVAPFLLVGVVALPALVQWPVPVSQAGRPVRRRAVFAGPQMAGGGW